MKSTEVAVTCPNESCKKDFTTKVIEGNVFCPHCGIACVLWPDNLIAPTKYTPTRRLGYRDQVS